MLSPPRAPSEPPQEPMQIDIVINNEGPIDDEPYIVENPTLDLETYASSYTGLAKLYRLMFIADHCPSMRVEALNRGMDYAKCTFYTKMYKAMRTKLCQATDLPEQTVEEPWLISRNNTALVKLEKLDIELKAYRNNSIKESIRKGYDEMGQFYVECGELSEALKCFARSRDYCTTTMHVLYLCWNIAKASIYLKNWPHVANAVARSESARNPAQPGEALCQILLTRLKVASALTMIVQSEYKSAATALLDVTIECCDTLEVVTPSNIAVYTGLCALATFERNDLRWNVIAKPKFKPFLELETTLRDIIFDFYDSKYDSCLKMLNQMKDNWLLDIYIGPHINKLYQEIRKRALVQYFTPYLSIDLRRMAMAFKRTVTELEDELVQIIQDGHIKARIDSNNKILYAKECDKRSATFEKVFGLSKQYKRRTRLLILNATMIKSKIFIKDPARDHKESVKDRESNALVPINNGNVLVSANNGNVLVTANNGNVLVSANNGNVLVPGNNGNVF